MAITLLLLSLVAFGLGLYFGYHIAHPGKTRWGVPRKWDPNNVLMMILSTIMLTTVFGVAGWGVIVFIHDLWISL